MSLLSKQWFCARVWWWYHFVTLLWSIASLCCYSRCWEDELQSTAHKKYFNQTAQNGGLPVCIVHGQTKSLEPLNTVWSVTSPTFWLLPLSYVVMSGLYLETTWQFDIFIRIVALHVGINYIRFNFGWEPGHSVNLRLFCQDYDNNLNCKKIAAVRITQVHSLFTSTYKGNWMIHFATRG